MCLAHPLFFVMIENLSREAYRYINQYGDVQMFFNHYDILHTLSYRDMVDGMVAFYH